MTRFEFVRRAILSRPSFAQQLLWTALAVALPTLLRWLLGNSAAPVPFVTYFPAILLTAVFLGWRWAAIATFAAAVIVNRVFLARPWLEALTPADIAILAFFTCSCAVLVLAGDTLRRTVRKMEALSQERELLHHEMHHWVQNTLGVVLALARGTNKDLAVADFLDDFSGRIKALSKANDVLRDGTAGSEIGQLVRLAIAPFNRNDCFVLEGPQITLPPQAGHHLVLILHELCTNALKHGALSALGGAVHISWLDHPMPTLHWQEIGGPSVGAPTRKGLGSKLMKSQQTFTVETHYAPEGVRCRLQLAVRSDSLTPSPGNDEENRR